jgi:hypothetical protein
MVNKGFSFATAAASSSAGRAAADVAQLLPACLHCLSEWAVPQADDDLTAAAVRDMLAGADFRWRMLGRTIELCVLSAGDVGGPVSLAVDFAAARAVVHLVARLLFARTAAILPEKPSGHPNADVLAVAAMSNMGGAPTAVAIDVPVADALLAGGLVHALGNLLLATTAAVMQAGSVRGGAARDAAGAARLALCETLVVLDAMVGLAAPAVSDEAVATAAAQGGDEPPVDSHTLAAAMAGAATQALVAAAQQAAAGMFRESLPPPLRLTDVATLTANVASHVAHRAGGAAPSCCVPEAEARMFFNATLPRLQMLAHQAAAHAAVPASAAAAPPAVPAGDHRSSVVGMLAARSAASKLAAKAQHEAPNAADGASAAGSGSAESDHTGAAAAAAAVSDEDATLPPGVDGHAAAQLVGVLAAAPGVNVTLWADGKAQAAHVRAAPGLHTLYVFGGAAGKKAKAAGRPLLAKASGAVFAVIRTGGAVRGGVPIKQGGGLFARKPKLERCVCMDAPGEDGKLTTVVQLEAASDADVPALCTALEGIRTVASAFVARA